MGSVVHKYVWYSGKVLNEWDILSSPFVERKDTIVCVRHAEISIAIQLISIWCSVLSFLNNTECKFKDSLFKPNYALSYICKICPLIFKVRITSMFYWRRMEQDETVVLRHSLHTCKLRSGGSDTITILRKSEVWSNVRVYKWNSTWNPNSKITQPVRPQLDRPTHRLCYCPAVFFRHFRLTALSFRQGINNSACFFKYYCFNQLPFKKKLGQSETAQVQHCPYSNVQNAQNVRWRSESVYCSVVAIQVWGTDGGKCSNWGFLWHRVVWKVPTNIPKDGAYFVFTSLWTW